MYITHNRHRSFGGRQEVASLLAERGSAWRRPTCCAAAVATAALVGCGGGSYEGNGMTSPIDSSDTTPSANNRKPSKVEAAAIAQVKTAPSIRAEAHGWSSAGPRQDAGQAIR
jgi:hypothetical protein